MRIAIFLLALASSCFSASLTAAVTPAALPAFRVGDWTVKQRATLDVAADEPHRTIHFVFGKGGDLSHSYSLDGGRTWSEARRVATGCDHGIAVDRKGTLHLVYGIQNATKMWYCTFDNGSWSTPEDITHFVPGHTGTVLAPRIAVDGNDNVHIIYWSSAKDDQAKDLRKGSRCAYLRKPAGNGSFEPPLLWANEAGNDHAKHGALAVDRNGDMHIFFSASKGNRKDIERKIRRKDGKWARHDLWMTRMSTDWTISAAIDAANVTHLALQRPVGTPPLNKTVYMNDADGEAMVIRHELKWSRYEVYTDLLCQLSGDIWIATGHVGVKQVDEEEGPFEPNIAAYYHLDAKTGTWTGQTPVSEPGYVNLDTRRGNRPKLISYEGEVQIYYAEKAPDADWTHQMRVLTNAPATESRHASRPSENERS